jgi:hypothetical protein
MFDFALATFVAAFAILAIIYGYLNYSKTKDKNDLRWVYAGVMFIVLIVFNILTADVFTFSAAVSQILHWVRLICDVGALIFALTLKVKK